MHFHVKMGWSCSIPVTGRRLAVHSRIYHFKTAPFHKYNRNRQRRIEDKGRTTDEDGT